MSTDPAIVWSDPAHQASAATHVMIVGVGLYVFGKGQRNPSVVGGDLRQLTSPPISARAIADWFITHFRNNGKPLGSVSLLVSDSQPTPYVPPKPKGVAGARIPPPATLANVRAAAKEWAARLSSHPDNLAVFYFCGHGVSSGQAAALLLEDFGEPGNDFASAVDFEAFSSVMKNSPAIQQVYFLDCCRTTADELYANQKQIGTNIVTLLQLQRGHTASTQRCVLFPTLDGEKAFGIAKEVSAFTRSLIDAMSFAAADPSRGAWTTSTGRLIDSVTEMLDIRVPQLTNRSTPHAIGLTSFAFNEIDEPDCAQSYVTVSDLKYWGQVELECVHTEGAAPPQKQHSNQVPTEACCVFKLKEGRWRFAGAATASPPPFADDVRHVRAPVAYVKLKATP